MKIKTAIILCGGRGSRLGSLGQKYPKSLLKVQAKPIIWYIIKALKKNSFNHFILPVGYKGLMIKNYFKKNKEFKNTNIEIIETGENTTIASRIFKIKKFIKSTNFVLLNGDGIFDFDLGKIYKDHEKRKNFVTFLGSNAQLPYGIVGIRNKKIISFERETSFNAILSGEKKNFVGHIYSGIAILRKETLNLKFKQYDNFEKRFYPMIIKKFQSSFKKINGLWFSIDNQKDLMYLNNKKNFFINKKIKKLKINLAR